MREAAWRRAWGTFGIVAFAYIGRFVTLPSLHDDQTILNTTAGGALLVGREPSMLSIAALGMAPAMVGYGISSAVHLAIPKLRAALVARNTELPILRTGLVLTTLLAVVQSAAVALFLQNWSIEAESIADINPWFVGTFLAIAAASHGLIPFAMERWGLGRGVAALVLAYCLLEIAESIHAVAFDFLVGGLSPVTAIDVILVIWVVAATVSASRRFHGDVAPPPDAAAAPGAEGGIAVAVLLIVTASNFAGSRLDDLGPFGPLSRQLAELTLAVMGGLSLSRGPVFRDPNADLGARKLVPLGTFILFAAMVSAFLTRDRLEFPWMECVVATLLVEASWREHARTAPLPSAVVA